MSFPRYPAYKDSGVEWLGEVPEHWEVKRIASLYREVVEQGSDELPVLSVSIHHGVSDSELSEEEMDRKVTRSEDRSKYKRVSAGDLVYNMMRAWQGAFGTVCVEGMVSPAYVVARPTSIVPSTWIEYLLRTDPAINEIKRFSRGITDFRLRLYWDEFKNLRVCLPPCNERDALLEFLDRETAKIDALIAEQQRLIELLQEKRQAVISHAVTKGLNPDAPMKDSGVEWLGEVPEHWEVGPLKRFLGSLNYKRVPLSSEERSGRQGDYPYYGASGVIDSVDAYLFDESLVLVSEDGANLLMRSTPISFEAHGRYWVNNHAHILMPSDGRTLFWSERIEALQITPFVTGSAQPKLTAEALLNLSISCPANLFEKEAIEERIKTARQEFGPLINASENAVALLKERRAALISAAVTGQIDVRGLVPEAEAA
jgi:type I restriction enzyme S subunit